MLDDLEQTLTGAEVDKKRPELRSEITQFARRRRSIPDYGQFVSNDAGRFFLHEAGSELQAVRLDPNFLIQHGFASRNADRLADVSHTARSFARRAVPGLLDYLILVPTLRCNLACSYCQVSRAPMNSTGFDWSEETIAAVELMLDGLTTTDIKLEFQGGEPTLRLDVLKRLIDRCERFANRSFVICTNLSELSPALIDLLENPDVTLSTSLDGDAVVHARQRTKTASETSDFFRNLRRVIERFGPEKVSALPTIDQTDPPSPDGLIEAYAAYGFTSIHLRPINFQGFARKRHQASADDHSAWWAYHETFVDRLIQRNFADRSRVMDESYLSLCLRRMFRIGLDRHVDLRNPNPIGIDYLVVDFDGRIYPTDEARMLARSKIVDLSIGDVSAGIDEERRNLLDRHSTSLGDPSCDTCTYQPYCGRDLIDDLSRYGRIDLPRHDTFFCQKHLYMFDLCVRLIYSDDLAVRYSLARWLGLSGEYLPPQPRAT